MTKVLFCVLIWLHLWCKPVQLTANNGGKGKDLAQNDMYANTAMELCNRMSPAVSVLTFTKQSRKTVIGF